MGGEPTAPPREPDKRDETVVVYAGHNVLGRVHKFEGDDRWFSEVVDRQYKHVEWYPWPHSTRQTAEHVLFNRWQDRIEKAATAAAQAEAADDIEFLENMLDTAQKDLDAERAKG